MQISAIIIASWQVSGTYISFSLIIQMRPNIPGMWNQPSLCLMGIKNHNAGAARGRGAITTGTAFGLIQPHSASCFICSIPHLQQGSGATALKTYSSAMCAAEQAAFSSLTDEYGEKKKKKKKPYPFLPGTSASSSKMRI